ncbi:hypothetical protein BHE90_014825 [Fusarium euwallaceae]|uniref:Uncharacterized protein n=1 Tax=Fusarium euwallaceae TaxID=1147111 RepID=A0A430L4V2_9HYPO|nr:hypothetical protein BHE90_014825 [Fusarium euwallaceae]
MEQLSFQQPLENPRACQKFRVATQHAIRHPLSGWFKSSKPTASRIEVHLDHHPDSHPDLEAFVMPDDFSGLDHASFFGVGHDLTTHTRMLEVSQLFYGMRKEIERQKSMLSSATVDQFRKRKTSLPENVRLSIQDKRYGDLLLPLIFEQPTAQGLNNYVIACLVLTKHHVNGLQRYGLQETFPRLFESVVGVISAQSKTIDLIDNIVIQKLNVIQDPISDRLKGKSPESNHRVN